MDVKRCDICNSTFDPATSTTPTFHTERLDRFLSPADIPAFDVCSPSCLAVLATRQDPTLAPPPTAPLHTLSEHARDLVHENLRWIASSAELAMDPDASPETATRLLTNVVQRAVASMSLFTPRGGRDPDRG